MQAAKLHRDTAGQQVAQHVIVNQNRASHALLGLSHHCGFHSSWAAMMAKKGTSASLSRIKVGGYDVFDDAINLGRDLP